MRKEALEGREYCRSKPKKTKKAKKAKMPSVGQKVSNPPNSPCKYAVAEAADTTAVAVS
jgi:hypothetical protein